MKYYTYIYWRKDGSPRYVGKGCGDRYKSNLHNVEVPPINLITFVEKDTTSEWAAFLEMELIDKWGRLDDGTGILENLTDGGEGATGRIVRGDTKDKLRVSNIKSQGRKVICLESGEVWNSAKDCKRKLGMAANYIYLLCNKKKESWRGLRFRWLDEVENPPENVCETKSLIDKSPQKIICVETGQIWDSVTECQKDLGGNIARVANLNIPRHKSYKGLHFRYICVI